MSRKPECWSLRWVWLGLAAFAVAALVASPTFAQDEDDEEPPPGLLAEYTSSDGRTCRRIDETIAFNWETAAPDERVGADFKAVWSGKLFVLAPDSYRLHVFVAGKVSVSLKGQAVATTTLAGPGWKASDPITLPYGEHDLRIEFEKTAPHAQLALYWSAERFALEPVPSRSLVSAPTDADLSTFSAGRSLVSALRCNACHAIPQSGAIPKAPSLVHARGNISRDWLKNWIGARGPGLTPGETIDGEKPQRKNENEPAEEAAADAAESDEADLTSVRRRMPHFAMSKADAAALAAYVLRRRENVAPSPKEEPATPAAEAPKDKKKPEAKPPEPSATAGGKLFLTLGCTACHTVEKIGRSGPFGGGDLSKIGDKRQQAWLEKWLAAPEKLNPDHRMPTFTLEAPERRSLALYLSGLATPVKQNENQFAIAPDAESVVARGEALWRSHRCGACHNEGAPAAELRPFPKLDAEPGCLGEPAPQPQRPGFRLTKEQGDAVREYLNAIRDEKQLARSTIDAGVALLETQNCLSCHARGELKGIAPQVAAVAKADASLAADAAGLVPPALHGIGDKLHENYLTQAVAGRQPRLRPWLSIRMPAFNLSDADRATLAAYFIGSDRIPERPDPFALAQDDPLINPAARSVAGGRLTTADGFGCTSCHQIGSAAPHKVALNAHGTNLTSLGERIRRPWYDRWVRNPARIVPAMEMPAVKLPVHGVLHNDLNAQLTAIWEALNTPGFEPPKPNPVQVVRSSGEGPLNERANVVLDAVGDGKNYFVKPLVIGLPNRHNVLFDMERVRLAGWWLGDTARQRTEGKSWYWEIGGPSHWPLTVGGSEFLLSRKSDAKAPPIAPALQGQFPTELDSFVHESPYSNHPGAATFVHTLKFEHDAAPDGEKWVVVQAFAAAVDDASPSGATPLTGFNRWLSIDNVDAESEVVLSFDVGQPLTLSPDKTTVTLPAGQLVRVPGGRLQWELADDQRSARLRVMHLGRLGRLGMLLEYRSPLAPDVYPAPPPLPAPEPQPAFSVAPGWRAQPLLITDAIMPTAMAWRPDGALLVASLRGEVWLFRDVNRDGLEDTGAPFCDKLAAPYGLAALPNGNVRVITKDALFELRVGIDHERAGGIENLASGWGRTLDYHDWVVGLPSDSSGGYYIAVPCHQDRRPPAAAKYHGKLLRLTPNDSKTPGQRFDIEEVCGGLRFPMGLIVDRDDRVFATDNQGNYNPFNELNHLLPGKRYGFINESEKGQTWPEPTPPAVALPHPWTRSVNGICLLEPPTQSGADAAGVFGAFKGHIIGCEYDTRRLVRMSLQTVDGVVQGAAYPFGETPKGDEPGLQGPVTCAVSPRGEIYVGSMRDSGWGAGTNIGSIVKIAPTGPLPAGVAEVLATPRGFRVQFTAAVDESRAKDLSRYHVASFRRISTPAYGGNDVDRRNETIQRVEVAADRRSVELIFDELRTGFVYEFQLQSLASGDEVFYPGEAYYTLNVRPRE